MTSKVYGVLGVISPKDSGLLKLESLPSLGEPYSVDVNGDGVVDRVHYRGDSEFIIKVDCPDGVIGCDQDNTEFVINDNDRWIIVDENPSIAHGISPGNPQLSHQ